MEKWSGWIQSGECVDVWSLEMDQSCPLCPRPNPKRKIHTRATQGRYMFRYREIHIEINMIEKATRSKGDGPEELWGPQHWKMEEKVMKRWKPNSNAMAARKERVCFNEAITGTIKIYRKVSQETHPLCLTTSRSRWPCGEKFQGSGGKHPTMVCWGVAGK